jgi:hypothetical protein
MKAALLLVLMTSTAAADGLGDGDVYLIRADGWAEPSCQKWHVDTNQQEMTHRAGKLHEEVSFDLSTIEIHFTEFKYTLDDTIGAEDVNANRPASSPPTSSGFAMVGASARRAGSRRRKRAPLR